MAIGDTINAGLLRTDYSPFNRAGVARGNVGALTGMTMGMLRPSPPRSLESNLGTPPSGGSPTQNMESNQEKALQNEFLRRLSGTAQTNELTPEAEEKLQKGINKFSSDDPRRKASVNDIEKFTQRIKEDPNNYKTVNVSDLEGNEFLNNFRDDPRLFGMAFDFNSKKIEAKLASQPKLGDSFASQIGSISPYYFSDSDAANAINQQASNLNITLTKDQLDLAMKKQKVIDPLKINELATKQIKQSKMDEAVDILQAGKDLKAFLEDGSPLSANVAKEKLARMIQPQGILTEDDLRRVGGSKGLRDRIDAAIEEMLTGKADAKTMQYLRDTAEIFERSASDKIKFEQPKVVSFLSRSFGITPEDTLKFTTLGKFQEYLPALPSNQSQNTNPQNQGSSPPPFQPTQLPGGGRFTPIR